MEIEFFKVAFQLFNFLIVFGALSYLVYKPIGKIIEERALRIEEGQKAVKKALEEQEKIEAVKKKVHDDLDRERAEAMESTTKEAEARKKEILAKAREEANQLREDLLKDWKNERANLEKTMKQEMAGALTAAVEKILVDSLDSKDHQKIVNKEINNLIAQL